jgi:Ca2+-binding EF-hand superfamily protein
MTSITKISLVALGIAVTSLTHTAAWGADAPRARAIDANGDGTVSREEATKFPRLAKHFDAIDTNKDGALSRAELHAHHAKHMAAKLKVIDRNHDGKLSRAEADAKAPRIAQNFDRIDSNHDGQITREEMAAARKSLKGNR